MATTREDVIPTLEKMPLFRDVSGESSAMWQHASTMPRTSRATVC